MRILIVDDLPAITRVLARFVTCHGHQAYVCSNSPEAVEELDRIRPDALFLDIAMPVCDGLQIAEKLKHRLDLRPPLLIAITGYSDCVMSRKIREAGFDHHLVKPVGWRELSAVLQTASAIS